MPDRPTASDGTWNRTKRGPGGHAALATRELVLSRLRISGVELLNPDQGARFVVISKVDDDSLPDRRASFHRTQAEARAAIDEVPPGWWPDALIDLDAPAAAAVRDAAAGDGSLGAPYGFDEDHVIFA